MNSINVSKFFLANILQNKVFSVQNGKLFKFPQQSLKAVSTKLVVWRYVFLVNYSSRQLIKKTLCFTENVYSSFRQLMMHMIRLTMQLMKATQTQGKVGLKIVLSLQIKIFFIVFILNLFHYLHRELV